MGFSIAANAIAITALATAKPVVEFFGNYFSTGAVSSNNSITEATSTLILLSVPNPVKNILSLWPGMGMSNGDLVQTLAISYPGDNNGAKCNVVGSNWCIVASSLLQGWGLRTLDDSVYSDKIYRLKHRADRGKGRLYCETRRLEQDNMQGQTFLLDMQALTLLSDTYNKSTTAYDQDVYLNNVLKSTLSTSAGAKALGWGTAEECQPGTPCGIAPKHEWINTSIKLNRADPGHGATAAQNGATGSISTSDGGVTWKVTTITVNQFDFTTEA
ncbi:hypothetical protein K461DRAFT_322263 [Myriangium duriaei CBS 260.36]|uniref:Uncharacterized protein n=1 Tax=Myriangium duriaei CBS 260.36 TaxID=1168546 RepID=A0A9P4IXX6_9PEZI|nr:hypothetical protein K461DRAFT_322263 [Myriangium duriaei CBS 260.36]